MTAKIVFIENDPHILTLVSQILRRAGYEVVTAADGVEGVRRVRETQPQLVVMDVTLPESDGYQVCHQLRNDQTTSNLPVLTVNALHRPAAQQPDFATTLDDYPTKPLAFSELLTRIQSLLLLT